MCAAASIPCQASSPGATRSTRFLKTAPGSSGWAPKPAWSVSTSGIGSFQFKEGGASPLPHLYRSRILNILRDDRGGVWIASEAGIYFFPHPGQLAVYFRAGAVPRRLLKDCFTVSLYQDQEGILWAGTFSGIFKYDLRTRQFSLCGPEFNEKEKEDFRFPVAAVCQDRRNWLWIGTYKTGLFGINRSIG